MVDKPLEVLQDAVKLGHLTCSAASTHKAVQEAFGDVVLEISEALETTIISGNVSQ